MDRPSVFGVINFLVLILLTSCWSSSESQRESFLSKWGERETPEMAGCVFDRLESAYGADFMRRYLDWLERTNSKTSSRRARFETRDLEFMSKSQQVISSCRKDEFEIASGKDFEHIRNEIEQAQKIRERTEAEKELRELRSKRARDLIAKKEIALFVVESSFVFPGGENLAGATQPMVTLSVENKTQHRISKAYFIAAFTFRGRAANVPRVENQLEYAIHDGLEPGGVATWTLDARVASGLPTLEKRDGLALQVTTTRLDGPDGKPLFERKWTRSDEERLALLRWKLGSEFASR